jgi:hypothetical protein
MFDAFYSIFDEGWTVDTGRHTTNNRAERRVSVRTYGKKQVIPQKQIKSLF